MQAKIRQISPLKKPHFVKPILIDYIQDEVEKKWEAVISHDSVSILLYHKERDAFIIVKQLRPPVLNMNPDDGMTHELCAGIVDKDMSLKQIVQEEVLEECGYNVPLVDIKEVTSFYTSVGISGAKQTFFYATVDATMQVNEGGGLADEEIEVIYLPLDDAKSFMFDANYKKTPGLLLGFYWFFERELTKTR